MKYAFVGILLVGRLCQKLLLKSSVKTLSNLHEGSSSPHAFCKFAELRSTSKRKRRGKAWCSWWFKSFELYVCKCHCLSLISLEMTWLFVFYRGIEQVVERTPTFFCSNKSPVCSQGSGAGEKWCHEAWEGWGISASHIKGLVSCCRRLQRERPKKGADWSLKLYDEGDTPMWKIWDVDIIDVG